MAKKNLQVLKSVSDQTSDAPQMADADFPTPISPALFDIVKRDYVLSPVAGRKMERRNLPMLVLPKDVPVGGAVEAEIIKIVESPGIKKDKGEKVQRCMWLKHETGKEFLFPITGVIGAALSEAPEDEIGKIITIVRTPDRMSGKYKKPMFVFEVYTSVKK